MKNGKQIMRMFLVAMMTVLLLPLSAFGAGSMDLNRNCSLTLSYQDGDTPLAGAGFSIYLAARMNESGELTVTDEFSAFNVDIRGENDSEWKTLASTLEGCVLRDGITPIGSGITDEKGMLSFPAGEQKLVPGLYFVLGEKYRQNGRIYDAQPFMLLLPSKDAKTNDWSYDVTVNPKHEDYPENSGDAAVTRKVQKVWKDKDNKKNRPKKVVIQLLRDGKVYDTVNLNKENNWRYTWENLDNTYRWTVTEKKLDNYKVKITREGTTFMVVNTWDGSKTRPSASSGNSKLPQTGQLWWPVPLLISAGLLLIITGLLRRRRDYR